MPTVHISQSQTGQFTANAASTTWIVDPDATIVSDGDFCFCSDFANTEVVVRGVLDHTSDAGSALALWKPGGGVTIAAKGKVLSASNGLLLEDDGQYASNQGLVSGNMGMAVYGDGAAVENTGRILGAMMSGIRVNGQDCEIVNAEGALIKGADGINTEFALGATTRVENHGTIEGDDWAYSGGNGSDIIVNRGKINGSILLGDGLNIFDTRGGKLTGDVAGGMNGDTYLIDDATTGIVEADGGGYDLLKTSVSYILDAGNEIEQLAAIGDGKVELTANDIDNRLAGNKASNVLKGKGGEDWLDGGKGDDTLIGGTGADHFVFEKGRGMEVVADFAVGEDILYVENFYLDSGYAELVAHMKEIDGSLVIRFGQDSVTLKGIGINDISESDVTFANL